MSLHLIAMHGWAGDQRGWQPFAEAATARGWQWSSGERGYGDLPPAMPGWRARARRVLVVHSLGLHLLPQALLAEAEAVVLLASFARFVPEGGAGRRLQAALAGMEQALGGDGAAVMLQRFFVQAADPVAVDPANLGIGERPLPAEGRRRLLGDLRLLGGTRGLPEGFPTGARLLIVEAGRDRIVLPEARRLLRQALPHADRLHLAGAGHCLLDTGLPAMLGAWLSQLA